MYREHKKRRFFSLAFLATDSWQRCKNICQLMKDKQHFIYARNKVSHRGLRFLSVANKPW